MAKTKITLDADIKGFQDKVKSLGSSVERALGKNFKLNIDTAALTKIGKLGAQEYTKLIKEGQKYAAAAKRIAKENEEYSMFAVARLEELKGLEEEKLKVAQKYANLKKNGIDLGTSVEKELVDAEKEAKRLAEERLKLEKTITEEFEKRKQSQIAADKAVNSNAYQRIHGQRGGKLREWGAKAKEWGAQRGGATGEVADAVGTGLMRAGPWGVAAAAVGGAYMGARALTAPARRMSGTNLELRGQSAFDRSDSELRQLRETGIASGVDPFEQMQNVMHSQKVLGETGIGDARKLAEMGLQHGVGGSGIADMASMFRKNASNRAGLDVGDNLDKTQKMLEDAFTSSFDKSGMMDYMSSIASTSEAIAEGGTSNMGSINQLFKELSASDFFAADANRSGKAAQDLGGMFKSHQGMSIATMMQMNPNMNALDAQTIVKQGGAFAMDDESFSSSFPGVKRQDFTKNFMNNVNKQAGNNPAVRRKMLSDSMGQGGLEFEKIFDWEKGEFKQGSEKRFGDIQKDMTGRDLDVKKNEANFQNVMITMGQKALPFFNTVEGQLLRIANHLTGVQEGDKSSSQLRYEREQKLKEGPGFFESQKSFNKSIKRSEEMEMVASANENLAAGLSIPKEDMDKAALLENTLKVEDLSKKDPSMRTAKDKRDLSESKTAVTAEAVNKMNLLLERLVDQGDHSNDQRKQQVEYMKNLGKTPPKFPFGVDN